MPRLRATKPIRFAGRKLRVGEEFDATKAHARIFKEVLRAAEDIPDPDPAEMRREELRARATGLGVDVDRRWGVDRLEHEIASAEEASRRQYQRRDMVAEEP